MNADNETGLGSPRNGGHPEDRKVSNTEKVRKTTEGHRNSSGSGSVALSGPPIVLRV